MATRSNFSPSTSGPPASMSQNEINTIDLTQDDDDSETQESQGGGRFAKRLRTEDAPFRSPRSPGPSPSPGSGGETPVTLRTASPIIPLPEQPYQRVTAPPNYSNSTSTLESYRPVFAGPSPSAVLAQQRPWPPSPGFLQSPQSIMTQHQSLPNRQVIDLTGSPSPPPTQQMGVPPSTLPIDLPPKTPVCIGLLSVTALVLYPVPYLHPQRQNANEVGWAPVRLQYEHNPQRPGGSETIHIKTPHERRPNGDIVGGEAFGVVEQKVATSLGPMLGKGLIRLEAKIRTGLQSVSSRCAW
jgi:SWI/SNF-related matrix-associated actin-dependent regulator of chromatin subfamily A3